MGNILYEGEWKEGLRHGQGTLYFPNTTKKVYEGGFYEGREHGKGVLYNIMGEKIAEGEWENGTRVSVTPEPVE